MVGGISRRQFSHGISRHSWKFITTKCPVIFQLLPPGWWTVADMGHACHMHAHTHSNIHFFSLSYLWLPLSANPFYHCIQHLLTEEKTHSRVPLRSLSVQFSRSVVSDSLRPHESQHARPPCPSPTPRVYSNSCPLSR